MSRLVPIRSTDDIFPEYRQTPIGLLLEYHNLNRPPDTFDRAQLLTGMCMDNRKHLRIPDNFSFIIRTAGANLRFSEFSVSFAIAVGRLRHIALIGHNNCRMVNLISRKDEFIKGLVEMAGWDKERAEEHFMQLSPMFEMDSETDFVLSETHRLRHHYPDIMIAPMFYSIDDNKLYLINEGQATGRYAF